MTSSWNRWTIALGAAACGAAGAAQERDPLAPLPVPAARQAMAVPAGDAAPFALRDEINRIGRNFDGKAGIAVINLRQGWEIDYNAGSLFPQQSCSKLWVAITALDAVDRGQLSLNDKVTLERDDLTLFHQPIAALILGGGHTTTL